MAKPVDTQLLYFQLIRKLRKGKNSSLFQFPKLSTSFIRQATVTIFIKSTLNAVKATICLIFYWLVEKRVSTECTFFFPTHEYRNWESKLTPQTKNLIK